MIQLHIETYFSENKGSVASAVSLWDAYKVTLRGLIIQLVSAWKHARERRIQDLSTQLAKTEAAWKS